MFVNLKYCWINNYKMITIGLVYGSPFITEKNSIVSGPGSTVKYSPDCSGMSKSELRRTPNAFNNS